MSDDILDRYSRDAVRAPIADGSFTPNDIFSKYDRGGAPATKASPSWQEIEALENAAAAGEVVNRPQAKKTEGGQRPLTEQSVFQNLQDPRFWNAAGHYAANIPNALLETAKYPGDVMQGNKPLTIEGTLGLASLATGGAKFGRAGTAAAVERVAPSSMAINRLVEAVGPENVPAAVNRLRENPRLTLADVSDPVRTMAQGLIDPAQPKAQNAIVQAVKERASTRLEAANSAFTEAMGPAPDVSKMVEGLKEKARIAGREAIQPALENSKLVDTSPVIKAIDDKLQPGINPLLNPKSELPLSAEQMELARFKQELITGSGEQLFDPQRLHRVQSDIGDRAYELSKSPDPKDRLLGKQLRNMNEKLIDQIDEASGGAYRPARQKFKDAKDISEAFESGFDTLKNRQGLTGALEDSPQAMRDWMKDATKEEIVARRLGTRADIEQKINTVKNGALKGETITAIPYNQEKLRSLFGNKEADRLIRVMKDSQDEALTNAKLLAGAKTAETQAGQRALAIRPVGGGNPLQYVAPVAAELMGQSAGLPGVGLAASLAGKGIHLAAQKAGQMHDVARNFEFAKNALAVGPIRDAAIGRMLSHPKVVRELKKSANALTAP